MNFFYKNYKIKTEERSFLSRMGQLTPIPNSVANVCL